jgi:hypothetical protein
LNSANRARAHNSMKDMNHQNKIAAARLREVLEHLGLLLGILLLGWASGTAVYQTLQAIEWALGKLNN